MKYLLLYSVVTLTFTLFCRPGSEKGKCKEKLTHKTSASLCGGALPFALGGFLNINNENTEQSNEELKNAILLECLRLHNEQQKCKDASSYQPSIY